MKGFKNYNKTELFNTIDKISIEKVGSQVVTKFDNRVINTSNVSNRYEIFDIVKYLKDKIELIEKNFTITKYNFRLTRGQQSLTLVSDSVEIGGVEFHKSFYILNSTDKSRRLSFNAGLKSDNFYTIGMNNVGMNKKHLTGVTQAAEDASVGLNGETFDEQIESLTSLTLVSDSVEIGGVEFHKSFYILNSTDKSRRLSFNAGLKSDNFYTIGMNNVGMNKKHLTGVTQAAEDASVGLNGETFDEQIESLTSLVGHRIHFSKLRQIILGEKEEVPQINHRKFDAFKNTVRYASSDRKINLTAEQHKQLFQNSESMKGVEHDFYLDAFWSFQMYLRLFNKQDSHIIKNETERIMKMTQWAVRNSVLEALGI